MCYIYIRQYFWPKNCDTYILILLTQFDRYCIVYGVWCIVIASKNLQSVFLAMDYKVGLVKCTINHCSVLSACRLYNLYQNIWNPAVLMVGPWGTWIIFWQGVRPTNPHVSTDFSFSKNSWFQNFQKSGPISKGFSSQKRLNILNIFTIFMK